MNLTQNKYPRRITLCALYFAQGMPYGFVTFLLSPYLASKGMDAEAIGKLGFISTIPWLIKFLWGPLIDKFTGSAMGRRRPWIIFAQTSMLVMMAALIFIPNVLENLNVLLVLIFVLNVFASLQDVSVDALAVESLKEDERAFVNGLMFGCSSGGAAFVSGVVVTVMARYGLKEAVMVQCAVLFLVVMLPLFFRERKGEKFLWFSKGQAGAFEGDEETGKGSASKGELLDNIAKAFSVRSALLMLLVAILVKIGVELHGIIANTFYIQDMGWEFEEFGKRGFYVEMATLASCFLGGFLADRVGHKKMAITGCVLFGLSYVLFALNPALWQNHLIVKIFFMIEGGFYGVISVSLFAMCMDITYKPVAGTQFTAYMAMMNGSAAIGKLFAGKFDSMMDYKGILIFWGAFQIIVIPALLLFIDPHERKKSEELGLDIYTKRRKQRALLAIGLVFGFLVVLVCYKIFFAK